MLLQQAPSTTKKKSNIHHLNKSANAMKHITISDEKPNWPRWTKFYREEDMELKFLLDKIFQFKISDRRQPYNNLSN